MQIHRKVITLGNKLDSLNDRHDRLLIKFKELEKAVSDVKPFLEVIKRQGVKAKTYESAYFKIREIAQVVKDEFEFEKKSAAERITLW